MREIHASARNIHAFQLGLLRRNSFKPLI